MMKRILALVLVIASLALALTGCAYRYDKKDMSKYATADFTKLDALLKDFEIEDGDFGKYVKDSEARDGKVLEKIDSILAGKIKAEDANKLSEDEYGFRQKIYFAYYCSVEIDDVVHYFNTKNMDDAKLTELLSNPAYNGKTVTDELLLTTEYLKAIFAEINGLSVKEYKYDSESSSAAVLEQDELVFVTFTYSYTDGSDTKTISTEYMPVKVGEAGTVGELLVGKSIGKIDIDTSAPLKFTNAAGKECTLSSLNVNFRAKGNSVEVPHTTYTTKYEVNDAANTATDAKIDLKDREITYHVYPAYAYAVAELTAANIIDVIFGESIKTTDLPCFTDDEDLEKIVKNVEDLKTSYDTLNSKATASGATQSQKDDAEEAKEKLDEAVASLYEDLIEKDTAVEGTILDDYKEKIYEELETAYDKDIRNKLATKIWEWAEKNITVDTKNLPKSAVNEAKDQILAVHKNTYYTGTNSSTNKAHTEEHENFKAYLANGVSEYKGKDVDEEIDKQAREDVAEIVRIYAIAQHYSDDVKRVTDADVSLYLNELLNQLYYNFYLSGNYSPTIEDVRDLYGDTALRASLTFNRIMDHFLATEEKDGHISYKNVTIKYN